MHLYTYVHYKYAFNASLETLLAIHQELGPYGPWCSYATAAVVQEALLDLAIPYMMLQYNT